MYAMQTTQNESVKAEAQFNACLPVHQFGFLSHAFQTCRGDATNAADDREEENMQGRSTSSSRKEMQAKLLTKLRHLDLRFDFTDVAELLAEFAPSALTSFSSLSSSAHSSPTFELADLAQSSSSSSSTAPQSEQTRLTSAVVTAALCRHLATAFCRAPAPALAAYADVLDKISVRAIMCGHWLFNK